MEKKEEAFEVYIMSLERFKRRSPKYLFMLDDHGGYDHQDIAALHDAWQAAKASAVPAEKNWDEIHLDQKERLYWSLRSSKKRKSDLNWHHASHQTCVVSTHGKRICEYLGVDPDGKDFIKTQELSHD